MIFTMVFNYISPPQRKRKNELSSKKAPEPLANFATTCEKPRMFHKGGTGPQVSRASRWLRCISYLFFFVNFFRSGDGFHLFPARPGGRWGGSQLHVVAGMFPQILQIHRQHPEEKTYHIWYKHHIWLYDICIWTILWTPPKKMRKLRVSVMLMRCVEWINTHTPSQLNKEFWNTGKKKFVDRFENIFKWKLLGS